MDWEKVAEAAREESGSRPQGIALVYGVGASLIHEGDFLVLGDITRWEIQLRYRKGMDNWRTAKQGMSNREKYKRGYFAEWRWADKVKDKLLPVLDFYLDLTTQGKPSPDRWGFLSERTVATVLSALSAGTLFRSGRVGRRLDEGTF